MRCQTLDAPMRAARLTVGDCARAAGGDAWRYRATSPAVLGLATPPGNSLRSLRSLCSNNPGESADDARCARGSQVLCSSAPPHARAQSPTVSHAETSARHLACTPPPFHQGRGRSRGPAAHGAAPEEHRATGRARSALRELTRRDCSSTANAVSGASSAAGRSTEHHWGTWPTGPRTSGALRGRPAAPPTTLARRSPHAGGTDQRTHQPGKRTP